ncbi:hypothetical protein PYW07_003562 [Mythimna separata]|uniref:FP protein C-terminal domain-containing protein n=1 Tax=Mythimna separata TaxID=271217 RepID=A0AAD8DT62_MYTSE|nr:hypothetical protein PYW07_003562 [Mythimna separata]
MPIEHSPPPQSAAPRMSAATLPVSNVQALGTTLSSSEPNLNLSTDTHSPVISPKITRNTKRKLSNGAVTNTLSLFMSEMREMFEELKQQQEEKYDKLLSVVNDIRDSLDFLSKQHEDLKLRVKVLETEREGNLKYISDLEGKLENMEQSARSTCIEIRNIPCCKSETKSSLLNTIVETGKLLNVAIQLRDVKDVFRIKTRDPAVKPIIVDFTSVLLKEDFLKKFRIHIRNKYKLTTEHLKISGPAKRIYISENLSAKNKRLFFLARDVAKSNQFEFCWVSHGKIYVRERPGSPHLQVRNESDLASIVKTV